MSSESASYFNVQGFRSSMTFDGARPNEFRCFLPFPSFAAGGFRGNGGGGDILSASTKFSFMARAAQIPGDTVNQVPVYFMGRELKFAGNRTFPEWTVTIYNDEDFKVRDAMERWLSAINSHYGNLRLPAALSPQNYQTNATVWHLGKTGNIIKTYSLIGLFPIDVSPIDLDWGANDTIEEFSVTFAYQWWEATAANVTDGTTVDPREGTGS